MVKKLFIFFIPLLFLNTVFAWYYEGWTYRTVIIIQEMSGTDLYDYQLPIIINTTEYIMNGKMNFDCSDIRFTYLNTTDNTEIPIPYWLESGCNTKNTKIWVRIPYIPAEGTVIIYMYYGNRYALSESSPENVFIRIIDGLVGAWHFEDNVNDTSGNNIQGTILGEPTFVDGVIGRAIEFDGVNDALIIQPISFYGWTEFTIVEWVYAYNPKANADWSKFSMIGDAWNEQVATYIGTTNGENYTNIRVYFLTKRTTDGALLYNAYDFSSYVNTWVHIVRRFTSSREYSVWLNGNKVYSRTIGTNELTILDIDPNTATVPERYRRFILGANSIPYEYMKHKTDELFIFNRALTDEEIADLYNNYGYTTVNYPGKVLVRKYVAVEPVYYIKWEESLIQVVKTLSNFLKSLPDLILFLIAIMIAFGLFAFRNYLVTVKHLDSYSIAFLSYFALFLVGTWLTLSIAMAEEPPSPLDQGILLIYWMMSLVLLIIDILDLEKRK